MLIDQDDRQWMRDYPESLNTKLLEKDIAVLKLRRELDKLFMPYLIANIIPLQILAIISAIALIIAIYFETH